MTDQPPPLAQSSLFPGPAFDVLALAASAGGVEALSLVLSGLPATFPAAVIVVQHRTTQEPNFLPEVLGRRTTLRVKFAEEGEALRPATVFLAPPGLHLLVQADGTLSLSLAPKVHSVRPSADLLFESVATRFKDRAIAVVLTGADSDGTGGLLNNAAKYTDTGGLVRLTVSQEGDDAVIRVRDNGVGIAPDLLPKVFDLFTQVDGSLGRSYGGLGIGLALARNLVEMQDGRLLAQSGGLGTGSEFTVKLPVVAGAPDREAKTTLEPGRRTGRSLRVLVVEDNVDAADSLSMLLRLYGHDVQVARTGPTALEMASASRPDVVLLDIGLPGMDGYQVAKQLRERPEFRDVMLCALTGYTPSEADRLRHQESGFDHYFVKPVSLEKLTELFEKVGPVRGPA